MWTLPRAVLPCPFCGSSEVLALSLGGSAGVLQCRTCNAQGPPGETQDLTLSAWDTRGQPLPRPCRWCQVVYVPHRTTQQYCQARCERAALRKLQEAEHRALDKERRRQAHQQAQAQERAARAQELAQRQWLLASS
jgi:hypothetical protein